MANEAVVDAAQIGARHTSIARHTPVARHTRVTIRDGEGLELAAHDRTAGGPRALEERLEVDGGTEGTQLTPPVRVLLELDTAECRNRLRSGVRLLDARLDELAHHPIELVQRPVGTAAGGILVDRVHLLHRQPRRDHTSQHALQLVEAHRPVDDESEHPAQAQERGHRTTGLSPCTSQPRLQRDVEGQVVRGLEEVLQQVDRGSGVVCAGGERTGIDVCVVRCIVRAGLALLITARQDSREPPHRAVVAQHTGEHEARVLQHVDSAQPIGQHMGLSPLLQAVSRQRQVGIQVDVDTGRRARALSRRLHLRQHIGQVRHPQRRDRRPHIIRRPEQDHVRG